ncbi:MAG TPA: ParB/RepB/Spo0J family partition protein [Beijerinckiaceae bacterium]|jgi:ParB family chromosome partitioning protein
MPAEATRPRLGRGLAALIGDAGDETTVVERARGQRRVPVAFLRANPRNPRKTFNEDDLEHLAASIRERGIIQPIVVRGLANSQDAYEIIAGERRWRAAQRAGLHEVPIVVVEADDKTALEFAIIENVQRSDLNAIEEASGYERLMSEFGYSQSELATVLGKSRSHLANTLRLLGLAPSIQALVKEGQISAGHARALLAVKDPERVAQQIIEDGLNVRDVERIAQADQSAPEKEPRKALRPDKDPDTRALEKALEDVLGLAVAIEHKGKGGEVRVKYKTLEQLDGLCRRLRH